MNRTKDIQSAIEKLPASERRKLVRWIESRQWDDWDRQIARDITGGKLDQMLRRVRQNIRTGKLVDMP